MAAIGDDFLRTQLEERRQRLQAAVAGAAENAPLVQLLQEVDSALERMEKGSYGLCATCHDPIEKDRLLADPLVCFCLDHLTREQQRRLEQDLELASQIQRALLPQQNLRISSWEVQYHYEPAGLVSGDYCDLIPSASSAGDLLFLLGDVSGKGVAASMLMAHLHAMFRSLSGLGLPLGQLVAQANRLFCESTMAGQFATLVCGRAGSSGEVEICNAGHCPTLLVRGGAVARIESTSVPLGMFCTGEYPAKKLRLAPGDTLFLYSDGLSERRSPSGAEYGTERLGGLVAERHALAPGALISACLEDLKAFSSGAPQTDDLTIMVIRRAR